MNPEIIRENVRERGTTPAETSRKLTALSADSFGSCRLGLFGVAREISFTPERSSVQIGSAHHCDAIPFSSIA